jgi:hypothetical protein
MSGLLEEVTRALVASILELDIDDVPANIVDDEKYLEYRRVAEVAIATIRSFDTEHSRILPVLPDWPEGYYCEIVLKGGTWSFLIQNPYGELESKAGSGLTAMIQMYRKLLADAIVEFSDDKFHQAAKARVADWFRP